MQTKALISVILFVSAVVLLEGNGYLIHHDLYGYGLEYSESWAVKDNLIKIALYQFVIFTLLFIHKNFRLFLVEQVFWLTCGQDIIFYLVWNNGVFPTGNWSWIWYNPTTITQLAVNFAAVSLSGVISHCISKLPAVRSLSNFWERLK